MTLNRRSLIAGLLVTPAIVRYSSLMKLAPQQPLIGKLEYPASLTWPGWIATPDERAFIIRAKIIDTPEHRFLVQFPDAIEHFATPRARTHQPR